MYVILLPASDPYCIIKCEGHAVRSKIVKNTLDAVWNISAVFYRKQMNKDILIEVGDLLLFLHCHSKRL